MFKKYCNYYDTIIDEFSFNEALTYYQKWCKENGQKPEIGELAELEHLSEEELNHVLYHAEIQGFVI